MIRKSRISHDKRNPRGALELHLQKMMEHPLLTKEGEVALARALERADLSITRALLGSFEGRAALVELARGVRAGEVRLEDAERSASEDFPVRLERAVARAARRRSSRRWLPRAYGLRLHPRAVRRIRDDLARRVHESDASSALGVTLARIGRASVEVDRVTNVLVRSNLRIVVTFARRYRGMPLADLVQEGNIGLLRAVDKFDHRRGLRFSTYAAWWIRHSLGRATADQSKAIRLPVHLLSSLARVRRAEDRMVQETGKRPSPAELGARVGLPEDVVTRMLEVVAQPVSLDAPIGQREDPTSLVDTVRATDTTPEAAAADAELRVEARELLTLLPDREAEVLRLRFGIEGRRERTLEEVGAVLSVSRERARQLERSALRKLRAASDGRRGRALLGA